MTLPSSGPLSITDIATEFDCPTDLLSCAAAAGLSTPVSITDFYGLSAFPAVGYFVPVQYATVPRVYKYDSNFGNPTKTYGLSQTGGSPTLTLPFPEGGSVSLTFSVFVWDNSVAIVNEVPIYSYAFKFSFQGTSVAKNSVILRQFRLTLDNNDYIDLAYDGGGASGALVFNYIDDSDKPTVTALIDYIEANEGNFIGFNLEILPEAP